MNSRFNSYQIKFGTLIANKIRTRKIQLKLLLNSTSSFDFDGTRLMGRLGLEWDGLRRWDGMGRVGRLIDGTGLD